MDPEGYMCNRKGRLRNNQGGYRHCKLTPGVDRDGYKVNFKGGRSLDSRGNWVRTLTGDEACEFEVELDEALAQ